MKNNAEGGFLDDGSTQDPVSGNEVPTGSLAEEVRDDIPAQLSEGEFVVPADVVRFIGLDKLMKMRDSAKSGLASMEAEGQIGGSPAPSPEMQMQPEMSEGMQDVDVDSMINDMEDEGIPQFSTGGFVQREDGSWAYRDEETESEEASFSDLMGSDFGTVPTTDTMTYVNADGNKIYIPVINGKAAYAPPEGYSLVSVSKRDTVEEVTDDTTTTNVGTQVPVYNTDTTDSPSRDFVQSGGREDFQKKVDISNQVQRKRRSELNSLAGADLSQEGIDAMYAALTPQAKNIYNERYRDPNFLDSYMAEGKSSTDLLITAQNQADRLNNERGITETDDKSTYSTEPTTMEDLAKAAKYIAAGLIFGPAGLIGAAKNDMTDAELAEAARVLKNSMNFFGTSTNQNKDKGRGNQPTETQLTGPTFNQAHWVKRMGTLAGEGLSRTEIQKKIRSEMNAIPAMYGTDAYGRKLSKGEISGYNNTTTTILKDTQDEEDKQDRTLAKMAVDAAKKKKEDAIQVELARIEEVESKKVKDDNAKQRQAETQSRKDTRERARLKVKTAQEEAVRKAAEDAATQNILTNQSRMQQRSTVNSGPSDNSGGNGNKNDNQGYGGGGGKGGKGKNTAKSGFSYGLAQGGMASKKADPIMKMRNDPTSGLAAKKKSKQKAQAKKGALAAKRT